MGRAGRFFAACIALATFGAALIAASPAQAENASATWHVAPGASGDCNARSACSSIDQAFKRATGGDVIALESGTYPVQVVHSTPTAKGFTSNVVVEPAPGAHPRLAGIKDIGPHLTFLNLDVDASSSGECPICGIELTSSATHSQVISSRLVNATLTLSAKDVAAIGDSIGPSYNHDGIDVANGADGVTIRQNYVHDLDVAIPNPNTVHVDCLQIYDASNVSVTANRLVNCSDRALIFSPGRRWGVTNVTVAENFIRGCVDLPCQGSGYTVDARTAPGSWNLTNLTFVFNTVIDGATLIAPDNPGLLFRNNIIGSLGNCLSVGDHNLIADYNTGLCKGPAASAILTPGTRQVRLPEFLDPASGDLHLANPDPVLRFANESGPAGDFDGYLRCQPSYVGADDPCANLRRLPGPISGPGVVNRPQPKTTPGPRSPLSAWFAWWRAVATAGLAGAVILLAITIAIRRRPKRRPGSIGGSPP